MNRNISDLETFNEKAQVLLNSSFMKVITTQESGVHFCWDKESGGKETLLGPHGESVSSALYTLRMFIQDNDRISIRNIGKIYESEGSLVNLRSKFNDIKLYLNENLDTKTGLDLLGRNYTYREALDVYLYATGHTNREKTEELNELLKAPLAGSLFKNVVNLSIGTIAHSVERILQINLKAIERLA